jgi:hypothetical protein
MKNIKKIASIAALFLVFSLVPQTARGQAALDMAGVQAEAEGWKLEFADDFDRTALGDNWKTVRGEWTLEAGMLKTEDSAHIVCDWHFTGDVRLEYEAITDAETPCDLSGVLNAKWGEEASGYYFGFGGQHNTDSFMIVRGDVVKHAAAQIVPGRRHQVICQREGKAITFVVDGETIISHIDERPVAKPGFDRVGLSIYAPGRFDNVRIYTKNDGKAVRVAKQSASKVKSYETTAVDIEAPLFEALFGDDPTPGMVIPYANKYDSRPDSFDVDRHQFAARRFGGRFVHAEQHDEAAEHSLLAQGDNSKPAYKQRGIMTHDHVIHALPGRSGYIALRDIALPAVHEGWGWIMDPRFLKEMSRQLAERAKENRYDYVGHFDELWTFLANRPVAKDKWYPQVEAADKEVREKYGFGKYGMPTSYADGDPFDRIAYARWAQDKLTTSFAEGYAAAREINPDMKVLGPTHGSSATSGDIEAWSKGFDVYGGQVAGAATNNLFDWARPGGTTKLYVDLSGIPVWMMIHMSKRHAPVRDPEYIREAYSQIFRNGGAGVWLMSREFYELEAADAMFAEPFKWNAMMELTKSIRTMRLPKMPETADSAILFSGITTVTTQWGGLSGDNDRHLSAYAVLGPCLGNWFHFVSDRQIIRNERNLSDYKTIFVPWVTYEYPEVLEAFKRYADAGGTLVFTDPEAFTWNINGEKFGAAWEELSGVRRIERRTAESKMTVRDGGELGLPDGFTLSALIPGNKVRGLNENVDTIATFPNGDPAITRHRYGQGKVYCFAADPLYAVAEYPTKSSTVAKGSPVVQFFEAIQVAAGVEANQDIWRFKLPPYKTDVYRRESGVCLTNNYVYDVNEPLLEPNNRDLNGTYTYARAPDEIADAGAADVPFRTGHITNRLAAFETRDKYQEPGRGRITAETPKWVVSWKDHAPIGITFDLKSAQSLTQCRLFFSGAMPALTVRGSVDGKDWIWLASTAEEIARKDVKDVRLYLGGAHRAGDSKNTGPIRPHAFRFVRFDFAERVATETFELCELDIWGP